MPDEPKDAPPSGDPPKAEALSLTQEQLDTRIAAAVQDRLSRHEKKLRAELPDQLLEDEGFRGRALKKWGAKSAKDEGKLDDAKIQEVRQEWEKEHLTPLQQRLQATEEKNGRLNESQLEAAILSAAGGMVRPGLLATAGNGKSRLFNMLASDFVLDPEMDEWRVRGKKDGEYRLSTTGEKVHMDPAEYLRKVWATDPQNADWILDKTKSGSGFNGAPGKDGKQTYTREDFRRLTSDPDYYAQHRTELMAADAEGRVR